eukprot:6033085-Alexandrium_andersonii.AAC.1
MPGALTPARSCPNWGELVMHLWRRGRARSHCRAIWRAASSVHGETCCSEEVGMEADTASQWR